MGVDMRWAEDGLHEDAYFQLNWYEMGRYIDTMLALGMAFPSNDPGPWPKRPTWEECEATHPGDDDAAYEMFESGERRAFLQFHGPEIPAIPTHKFGSNDGWWVLPGECTAAIRAWEERAATPEVGETEYWQRWIGFLRDSAEHGGFRVR